MHGVPNDLQDLEIQVVVYPSKFHFNECGGF